MTITYGFYDSVTSDRLYNAKQMGSIFDGLILDGVYPNYGDALEVLEDTGMDVSVGVGRAWFNHTWSYNDALLGVTVPTADALLDRIDIVYLEIDESVGVRANKVDILEGTPASTPVPPTLQDTTTLHQYALAHIYVGAGVTSIVQGNITDMIGTSGTPFVELVTLSEDMQAQIYAIVGDTNPPLIDLLELKAHDHTTDVPQIDTPGIADLAVEEAKIAARAVTTTKMAFESVTYQILDDNAVTTSKIAATAISDTSKFLPGVVDDTVVGNRVPMLPQRVGGSPTDWDIPGATAYTPGHVMMLAGCVTINIPNGFRDTGSASINFPLPNFDDDPIVILTPRLASSWEPIVAILKYTTNSSFTFFVSREGTSGILAVEIQWLAIGPE